MSPIMKIRWCVQTCKRVEMLQDISRQHNRSPSHLRAHTESRLASLSLGRFDGERKPKRNLPRLRSMGCRRFDVIGTFARTQTHTPT